MLSFKTKTVSKHVVGKSKDLKLKSVVTTRAADLFVSRLHPSTVGSELRECVESVAGLSKIAVVETKSDKLKSRVEGLYSSFHVLMLLNCHVLWNYLCRLNRGPVGLL